MPFADLNTTWFALIGLLWAGYLFLEGFDFGVAIVTPFIAKDEIDRRICINTVGPVWDGNEVWLLVAGGATFAAFPRWYANLFSGFYLALFLVLVALIVRGVSFEYRGKEARASWRRGWDIANFVGSLIPAIVWGAAFVDLAHGLPLSSSGQYSGGLLGLLHPIALLGGVASLALFSMHGSVFLSLKTSGELARHAAHAALLTGIAAAGLVGLLVVSVAVAGRPSSAGSANATLPLAFAIAAVILVVAGTIATARGRAGWAFVATGTAIILLMGAVFSRMFPDVLPASNLGSHALTIATAASQHNTLNVMTIVAAIFTPFVLAYQAWSYWVFRQRLVRPPQASEPSERPGERGPRSPQNIEP